MSVRCRYREKQLMSTPSQRRSQALAHAVTFDGQFLLATEQVAIKVRAENLLSMAGMKMNTRDAMTDNIEVEAANVMSA